MNNCTCISPQEVEQTANLIQYATCVLVSLLVVLKTIGKVLKKRAQTYQPAGGTSESPVEATPKASSAKRTTPRVVQVGGAGPAPHASQEY